MTCGVRSLPRRSTVSAVNRGVGRRPRRTLDGRPLPRRLTGRCSRTSTRSGEPAPRSLGVSTTAEAVLETTGTSRRRRRKRRCWIGSSTYQSGVLMWFVRSTSWLDEPPGRRVRKGVSDPISTSLGTTTPVRTSGPERTASRTAGCRRRALVVGWRSPRRWLHRGAEPPHMPDGVPDSEIWDVGYDSQPAAEPTRQVRVETLHDTSGIFTLIK